MSGSRVALDTNQAIAVLNNTDDAGQWIQSFTEVYLPENDLWIAALCVEHNMPLATSDEHFTAIEELQLIVR